ncbi:MAG: MlaC/ttg2D family ABC transporter substrate-binding protein [Boseongicola sp.]
MKSDLTRRSFVGSAVSLVALSAHPALALSSDEARKLIDRVVGDINSVINSGKSQNSMFRDFENVFRRYADVPTIARSALGPPARTASKSQIKQFSNAFTGYLARKYGRRFREFIGGKIRVTGARKVKSFQEVQAVADLRGQPPFAISFMVSDRSGSDRFFDLLIEGISLLKSERAEIGTMLDRRRGDIDALIKDLSKTG